MKKKVRFIDEYTRKARREPESYKYWEELNSLKDFLQYIVAENELQRIQLEGFEKALNHKQN